MSLRVLHADIRACTACPGLAPHAKFPDRDYGNLHARSLLVGEAPGERSIDIDRTWSGQAGLQLRKSLREATGKELEDAFYLTNVLKCCPPGNRDPTGEEVAQCRGHLSRELELVKPEHIVCVGRFATDEVCRVLKVKRPKRLRDAHGTWLTAPTGERIAPLVHPSWGPRTMPTWAEGARRVLAEAVSPRTV